jgi:hypothetical protein
MDTAQLIWIIVAIIVVIAVVAIIAALGRKKAAARAEAQREADRRRAGELRETAQAADLQARERDAAAMKAQADAEQAQVEAEKLRLQAERHNADAESGHQQAQEHLRQAADLDPDGARDGKADSGRNDTEWQGTGRPGTASADAGAVPEHRDDVRQESGQGVPERGTVSGTDTAAAPRRPDDGRTT